MSSGPEEAPFPGSRAGGLLFALTRAREKGPELKQSSHRDVRVRQSASLQRGEWKPGDGMRLVVARQGRGLCFPRGNDKKSDIEVKVLRFQPTCGKQVNVDVDRKHTPRVAKRGQPQTGNAGFLGGLPKRDVPGVFLTVAVPARLKPQTEFGMVEQANEPPRGIEKERRPRDVPWQCRAVKRAWCVCKKSAQPHGALFDVRKVESPLGNKLRRLFQPVEKVAERLVEA